MISLSKPLAAGVWFGIGAVVSCAIMIIAAIFVAPQMAELSLTNSQAAFWNVLIKAVGGVAVGIGAVITVTTYFNERRKDRNATSAAQWAPLLMKRQEVYEEMLMTTSTIGNREPADPEWHLAARKFWLLYWGPIPLVCDEEVAKHVNDFSEELVKEWNGVALRNISMNLGHACRKSLRFPEDA